MQHVHVNIMRHGRFRKRAQSPQMAVFGSLRKHDKIAVAVNDSRSFPCVHLLHRTGKHRNVTTEAVMQGGKIDPALLGQASRPVRSTFRQFLQKCFDAVAHGPWSLTMFIRANTSSDSRSPSS